MLAALRHVSGLRRPYENALKPEGPRQSVVLAAAANTKHDVKAAESRDARCFQLHLLGEATSEDLHGARLQHVHEDLGPPNQI